MMEVAMAELLKKLNKRILTRARRIREDLHRHPELSFQEHRTSSVVAERLRALKLDDVRTGIAGTGVLGLLRGGRKGKTVALRADMDALPILEETGVSHASTNPGVMHACGHDGHTAILLGAAEALASMRDEIAGNVKFVFQPAEEGLGGAVRMVEGGCLRDPKVHAIFALHGLSAMGGGKILLSPTPAVAANLFEITVEGSGGHGAMPHVCVDPVVIAAQIIVAAQTIVSREVKPDEPAVLSFCSLQAGTKSNIIPDRVRLLGTIRAMEMRVLKQIFRSLGRVARGVAKAMRGRVTVREGEAFPPVKNDPGLLEMTREVALQTVGAQDLLKPREQLMGAEDFAYYLTEQGGVPGVLFWLGVETDAGMHTSRFDFGSEALEPGILMMANCALRFLQGAAGQGI
jgi:amidohydrolase